METFDVTGNGRSKRHIKEQGWLRPGANRVFGTGLSCATTGHHLNGQRSIGCLMPKKVPKVILLMEERLVDVHFRVELRATTQLAKKVTAKGKGTQNVVPLRMRWLLVGDAFIRVTHQSSGAFSIGVPSS